MTLSDWIQLFGAISALFIGIVSIVISVKTLKQNSEMVEESTRPYVVVYHEILDFGSAKDYFVIKNFGQTGATILKLQSSDSIESGLPEIDDISPSDFQKIEGCFLAPNQSINFPVIQTKKSREPIDFLLEYKSSSKIYSDKFVIDCDSRKHIPIYRSNSTSGELKTISYTLQELVERQL